MMIALIKHFITYLAIHSFDLLKQDFFYFIQQPEQMFS